jgi:hypothetical protein
MLQLSKLGKNKEFLNIFYQAETYFKGFRKYRASVKLCNIRTGGVCRSSLMCSVGFI